jgi:hypothetical protein
MIARISVAALVLSLSPWLFAQQATSAAQITLRGCVMGAQRYTFMQASTGAEYNITESNIAKQSSSEVPDFSSLCGKLIEITGNEYAPNAGQNSALPTLSVNKVRIIADQCPIHPGSESRAANIAQSRSGDSKVACDAAPVRRSGHRNADAAQY